MHEHSQGARTPDKRVTVAVLEDNEPELFGIEGQIRAAQGLEYIGGSWDPDEVLALVVAHRPDVAVIDDRISDDDIAGIRLIREIKDHGLPTVCLLYTNWVSPRYYYLAMQAGANGFAYKTPPHGTHPSLVDIIFRCAYEGGYYTPAFGQSMWKLIDPLRIPTPEAEQRRQCPLSDRQLEVLRLVAQGLQQQEIADRLFLSPHTVHDHMKAIRAGLGVSTLRDAVWMAQLEGWLHLSATVPEPVEE
jgi:DNA-binding NarL/FixJ family response regulator